jgi:hypothetical protein
MASLSLSSDERTGDVHLSCEPSHPALEFRALHAIIVGQFCPSVKMSATAVRSSMRNEFTAIVEQDGPWFVAYCAEVPGANGQGKTREECLANLREAIALVLDHRR